MPKKFPLRGTAAPHPPFVSLKFVIGSEDISGKPSRRDKAVFVGGEGQPLVRLCIVDPNGVKQFNRVEQFADS